ncbi:hypothetical protein GCM10017783_11220 [Deinococcus piscis]|uniref:DUF11 domain-containing protein n=1 Tax=Deinococcus piscis TaxID=394230 RepID=A0ABQ3K5G1_9DEIO|nr:DUF11 domain-containing protein [Deinococcus piscis]GHG00760.1 hypothetical protein GCM10017783_11220 [Deinococcus piscis]
MPRLFALSTLTLSGLLCAGPAFAQLTPSGTQITNQASAQFVDAKGQTAPLAYSNTVVTTVQEICAVSVLPNGSAASPAMTRTALPGDTVLFPYTLTNSGNTTSTFPVRTELETGNPQDIQLSAHVDLNGNGQIDPSEPAVQQVTLDAGASVTVLVRTATATTTEADSALINVVASCPGGASVDADNISALIIGTPPEIQVEKAFEPQLILPGQETTVRLRTVNSSDQESREVVLTDLLAEQLAGGLEFVAGSASASAGRIEYFDGGLWQATPPAQVRGVRLVLDRLAPGEAAELTFRMRAQEQADGQQFLNVATAQTSGRQSSANATLSVRYTPAVAIGPVGQATAEEGSPADTQTKPFAQAGEEVCFDHDLRNTGDVADLFTVTVTYPESQAGHVLYGPGKQPLAQPIYLEPGQQAYVQVCYTPVDQRPVTALITVAGERGTTNATTDYLRPLPQLVKTVVDPQEDRTVRVGDLVTYQLRVTNTYGAELHDVRISDPLPVAVDYVSSQPGGQVTGEPGAQVVHWDFASLAPGESRTVELTVRVTDRGQMGESVANTFNLVSTELPPVDGVPPVTSEPATVHLPIQIRVVKQASAQQANVGDRVTFTLTITNPSPVADLTPVRVVDVLADPASLDYIPGSSTISYGPQGAAPLADPVIGTRVLDCPLGNHQAGDEVSEVMQWTLPTLKAGQSATLTYDMRVEAGAAQQPSLRNFVLVTGTGPGGATDIAEDFSEAEITLNLQQFRPVGELIGQVYVDRNRSGTYDKGVDTPLNRARVVLAGGRIALTDQQGRYSFLNVPLGTHAVRLDPGTTPYLPLTMPQEGGLNGTQTVHVRGLTSADFPLAPLGGEIDVIRRTTLNAGPLTVHKTVARTAEGYSVTLTLSADRPLQGLRLNDPLPAGAQLLSGTPGFEGTLPAGERQVSYSFSYSGEPRSAVTDPQLEWRQP